MPHAPFTCNGLFCFLCFCVSSVELIIARFRFKLARWREKRERWRAREKCWCTQTMVSSCENISAIFLSTAERERERANCWRCRISITHCAHNHVLRTFLSRATCVHVCEKICIEDVGRVIDQWASCSGKWKCNSTNCSCAVAPCDQRLSRQPIARVREKKRVRDLMS